ncbi:MerR family transcriptional regulator [Caulobacter sp. SLTY]|uniref:MerR family transcriptional regulator n=1 Tax=Caulobacter sp. SLTY TaxID=2683262 RepID=UPI001411FF9B|nr:MerR family transcriptional regulator [Caulobacter sp. SLTY]NBB15815.1 MerR family transcriptional regulator [Caulobacter sp. SLTY]
MAKGPNAFRTISEAAEELGAPQHVLRFWETKFAFISPMKRAGGRRFYRPQDIEILRAVRTLLHDEGYTIKGVQKLHKDGGLKRLLAVARGEEGPAVTESGDLDPTGGDLTDEARVRLTETLGDLEAIKARLDGLLKR